MLHDNGFENEGVLYITYTKNKDYLCSIIHTIKKYDHVLKEKGKYLILSLHTHLGSYKKKS